MSAQASRRVGWSAGTVVSNCRPGRLAAYLGGSDRFDQAIADFAETYADQNEDDFTVLQAAAKEGRAEASTGI
ncbi:DUF2252 family protein [Kitasatospora sp. NPDC058218]|uniref:DUF2252 family protein n=1 Tax=Kitasatospora sp. NPDC058218 TaxID=3346385 RepID=UPI0036DAF965